jgi:23S rRNA (guanosine2251-2'-O)-methyltransferase
MQALNKKEAKKLFKEIMRRPQQVELVLENIQYARNVAGMFRTADAAGVSKIYLTGISQKPPFGKEMRQVSRSKEKSIHWQHVTKEDTGALMERLKRDGFYIIAIEIAENAYPLSDLPKLITGKEKICFVAGSEVFGVTKSMLQYCDAAIFIPMYGRGASLNVTTSVGIALYSF